MIYVIGDIHGEYGKLCGLLAYLEKDATEYVFLGDYIDKGGESKQSVDMLVGLGKTKKCTFLMGDHEFAWLEYLNGNDRFRDFLLRYGGVQTLESYSGRGLTPQEARLLLADKKMVYELLSQHMEFYSKLRYYYAIGNEFVCMHGGINPINSNKPLERHSKEEMVFIRNEFIYSGFLYHGKRIIFGHTAFRVPYVDACKIGVDTGATYKEAGYGHLTAFNVTKNEFINSDGERIGLVCKETEK